MGRDGEEIHTYTAGVILSRDRLLDVNYENSQREVDIRTRPGWLWNWDGRLISQGTKTWNLCADRLARLASSRGVGLASK